MQHLQHYIPDKLKVGIVSKGRSAGLDTCVLACLDGARRWMNSANFEFLTGYRPACSRKRSVEIMKVLEGAVYEIANTPVTGFRVEQVQGKCVDYSTAVRMPGGFLSGICDFEWQEKRDWRLVPCVRLKDPRGYDFLLGKDDFDSFLKTNRVHMNRGGELDGSFLWGVENPWTGRVQNSRFRLYMTGSEELSQSVTEREVIEQKRSETISGDDLVPGRIYVRRRSGNVFDTRHDRVLYLGAYNWLSSETVGKCMKGLSTLTDQKRSKSDFDFSSGEEYLLRQGVLSLMRREAGVWRLLDRLPWQNEEWKAFVEECGRGLLRPGRNHVFITLPMFVPNRCSPQTRFDIGLEYASRMNWNRYVMVVSSPEAVALHGVDRDQNIRAFDGFGAGMSRDEALGILRTKLESFNSEFVKDLRRWISEFPVEKPADMVKYRERMQKT